MNGLRRNGDAMKRLAGIKKELGIWNLEFGIGENRNWK